MRRRDLVAAALGPLGPSGPLGAAALPGGAGAAAPCATGHPGLGRGFHLGEVIGRTARDFDDMAAAGASLVRFGIPLRLAAGGGAWSVDAAAVGELHRQIALAASRGLRILPVLRPPSHAASPLWGSETLQASLEDVWRRLAASLAGHPTVAAFDLVNEPQPPGADLSQSALRWQRLALRLATAIRTEDPARTLVAAAAPGARPMAFRHLQPLPLPNLVYGVHLYEPFEFTHQRLGDPRFSEFVDFPGPVAGQGVWDKARLRDELAPVRAFAASHGATIHVGEFGAVRWAPGAARERYLGDLLALLEEARWGWTYHAFREWHGWDAEMTDGGTAAGPARERSRRAPVFVALRDAMQSCGATPRRG